MSEFVVKVRIVPQSGHDPLLSPDMQRGAAVFTATPL